MENNNPIPDNAVVTAVPAPIQDEKPIRTRVRKVYNSACLTLLIQFGIASVISGFLSGIYSGIVVAQAIVENHNLTPETLIELLMDSALDPMFLLISTIISYLIANVVSYCIGNALIKRHHTARIFGKIQWKPLDCILAIFSVLGIQMVSLLIQSIVMTITRVSGIDESTAGLLSFSDNALQNILLVLYTVVIAAITEELLLRGVVLRALSVKSMTFAWIASSLLFGLMHGNLNQIFNGFLLGLVFGYAAIKSKSIFLPILLHMCANGHAMLLSFLEYKFGESIVIFEFLYILVMAQIGIGATVWLLLRNKMPKNETDGFPVTTTIDGLDTLENPKGLTWPTLFKSPLFWVFCGIYLFSALASMTILGM